MCFMGKADVMVCNCTNARLASATWSSLGLVRLQDSRVQHVDAYIYSGNVHAPQMMWPLICQPPSSSSKNSTLPEVAETSPFTAPPKQDLDAAMSRVPEAQEQKPKGGRALT
jgi:hypothetical protein